MTARQIELARHALGLRPGRLVSCRNNYPLWEGDGDIDDWSAMVAAGFATAAVITVLRPAQIMFHLTRAGAERALRPGDVLDPEDWP